MIESQVTRVQMFPNLQIGWRWLVTPGRADRVGMIYMFVRVNDSTLPNTPATLSTVGDSQHLMQSRRIT